MDQLIQFTHNHWVLAIALVVTFIGILVEEIRNKIQTAQGISPAQLTELLNSDKAYVVDIRDAEAFRSGHITSSVNIHVNDYFDSTGLQKLQTHKNKTIVIIDQDGSKAARIAQKLKKEGFENISTLVGGITGWKNAILPLI